MPNYASSFVNGAAPGVRSVDNVARYRIVKDTVNGDGSPILSNSTDTIADFAAMYASLLAEVSALASLVGLTVRVASTANVAGTYNNGSSGGQCYAYRWQQCRVQRCRWRDIGGW